MKKLAILLALAEEEYTVEEFFEIVNATHIAAYNCVDSIAKINEVKTQEEIKELIGQVDIFCSQAIYGQEVIYQHPKVLAELSKAQTDTARVIEEIDLTEKVVQKFLSVAGFKHFPFLKYTFTELDKQARAKIKV